MRYSNTPRRSRLLQVERRTAEREEERRLGAELLAGLVDGCIDGGVAQHQLTSRGLASGPLVSVAWGNGEGERGPGLHHRLADRLLPHLMLRRSGTLVLLLPARADALTMVQDELEEGARIGVSSRVDAGGGCREGGTVGAGSAAE